MMIMTICDEKNYTNQINRIKRGIYTMAKEKSTRPYYVSNVEFYQEMVDFLNRRQEAIDNNHDELPQIPDSICEKIMKIANKLANKPNFRGYSYRDEMILDGIEDAIKNIHKFNPEKSDNPFSYFTTTIYNAFVRRIKLENKELERKKKYLQNRIGVFDSAFDTQSMDNDEDYGLTEYMEELKDIYYQDERTSSNEDKSLSKKKEKSEEHSPLEQFME